MIVCFSGTGNSRHVAGLLADALGQAEPLLLRGPMLYDPMAASLTTTDDIVLWVFPTYSWGVPPVVRRVIRETAFAGADRAGHYMVTTCGDDVGHTARQWRRLIASRGWRPVSAYSVQMPNTYVCMKGFDVDSPDVAQAKLDAAPARVAEIAARIAGGTPGDLLAEGSWPAVKTAIVNPYFTRFCMSPKPFRSNGRCTGCGRCARQCPMDNIVITDGRPEWHDRCALCLRCYHCCHTDAVEYGRATDGKGQYFLK